MNCANHPERERIAFCQNCGKALCQECTRVVGTAVFCEPCLEARLAGTQPPPTAGAGYASGNAGGVNFTTSATGGSNYAYTDPATGYTVNGSIPPPPTAGAPNPGLAALLGFIPGVGAMYNGQYAKGIVHLIVFAVLVSLADEHGIFGLFVAGWVFYQVFEAYQTARARRDATPLPNPFGLNDLGDRLGFGKSWAASASANANPAVSAAYTAPEAAPASATAYPPPQPSSYPPPGAGWGAPADNFPGSPYNSAYVGSAYAQPPTFDPNAAYPRNRFPTGAIWLIGLGAIFLIGNTGLFHGFPVHRLFPIFLIGLGLWLFYYKMTAMGGTLADDGTPLYRMRLFSALRGSIWVILVGIMFFLSAFNILSWGSSWPLFIIVAGVMILAEKTLYNQASVPPGYPAPPVPPATPPNPVSVVPPSTQGSPSNQSNQEGR